MFMPGCRKGERACLALATLGCKLNQSEGALMVGRSLEAGYRLVPFGAEAEVFVINSCTVTARSDREVRQLIGRARRLNPRGKVVLTGCYPQANLKAAEALPGVDLILGNEEKLRLPEHLSPGHNGRVRVGPLKGAPLGAEPVRYFPGRTRAFLKVQDGCNFGCTYCIVPRARGTSRSLPLESMFSQATALVGAGYREVVLTGAHLGSWGLDLCEGKDLLHALRRLRSLSGSFRLRLSSLEPLELEEGILEEAALAAPGHPLICPHFHLPLQSGDDAILRAMGRPYTSALYAEKVEKLLSILPHACIGADVMVGFPGEDEASFDRTLRFISSLRLAYLHVFSFSRREGTAAASLPGQIPESIKRRRSALLRELGREKRRAFLEKARGSVRQVLIEGTRDRATGLLKGYTDNYIRVLLPGTDSLMNSFLRVRLGSFAPDGQSLMGAILEGSP